MNNVRHPVTRPGFWGLVILMLGFRFAWIALAWAVIAGRLLQGVGRGMRS